MSNSKSESIHDPSLQEALADITLIRRTIDRLDDESSRRALGATALDANIILQVLAFIASLGLGLAEVLTYHEFSYLLHLSQYERESQVIGMGFVAYILAVILGVVYYVIWRASKRSHETVDRTIAKNFSYLKNLSLVCDLFVKFCIFFLIIAAQKPAWIAPILLLFIGDFLVQGKFFTLPVKSSLLLGVACFAGAAWLYLSRIDLLMIPFFVFAAVTAISVSRLIYIRSRLGTQSRARS